MAGDSEAIGCSLLKEPLSLSDLIANGTNFQITTDFNDTLTGDLYDELILGSDNENEDSSFDEEILASPWTKSFKELKGHMVQINDHMYKKITKKGNQDGGLVPDKARVCIRYNAYWEFEGVPFDSSFLRGSDYKFYTGTNEVIEGLEAAVLTMKQGEQAQFIISYHLLFREMGCPPRVRPRADGLFIIELMSFTAVGDIDAEQQLSGEERNKFSILIHKVKDIHLKGVDFFGQKLYKNASRAFEKAVDLLTYSQLESEQDQKEQNAFLIKLYTNLSVCYIKINAPGKTCIVCKEIRRLTNNKPSAKALFQEGKALYLLGEYRDARELLISAQLMEPTNNDIKNILKLLNESYSNYKENEIKLWSKAFGANKAQDKPKEIFTEFEQSMFELMKSFNESDSQNLQVPNGLTKSELTIINNLADRLNLKLNLSPIDNTSYSLHKLN